MLPEEEEEDFTAEVGLKPKEGEESKAILVGTYSVGETVEMCNEHLNELENLAETFGVPVISKKACSLKKIESATYLSSGKLEDLTQEIADQKVTLCIFDDEITPAQQRNLEKLLKVAVMDRTELILEIFAARAQTREARLQIELAKVRYEFPRLKRMWSHFSRQRASGGYLKGEGEKQLEIDRRLLKRKVEQLNEELKTVKKNRETQKNARLRSGVPTFAIIGYTNAGKSTLLNALTGAGVLAEDRLFATLDPTTRKFLLPNHQEILLTDTVGFIRKLPHTLIAAFKSTLESALQDDVLLHIIDASHPLAEEHAKTTCELLKTLNAREDAIITVLNKVDKCTDPGRLQRLRFTYSKTVQVSSLYGTGFDELLSLMIREIQERRKELFLRIPQKEYNLISELRRFGNILQEDYEENDVLVKAEIPLPLLYKFENYAVDN